MNYHKIIPFLLGVLFTTSGIAQESELEKDFINTVEQTRDRIMTMFGEGELATVQYEEERAMVRQAEQVAQLLREGVNVDEETLESWITKLKRLGVSQSEEGEGVQYREKPWFATGKSLSEKIEAFEEELKMKYEEGDIDKKAYERDKRMLQSMKTQLETINEQMTKLENQLEDIEARISQYEKEMK